MSAREADAAPAAQLLTVGDELLSGDTTDTNRAFLGQRCRRLGIEVHRAGSVRDRVEEIAEAVADAARRFDVCLVSGGLGPTTDDLTALGVARAAAVELHRDAAALAAIEAKFRAMGRPMAECNRKQADLPIGSRRLENPIGTAPGFSLTIGRCLVCCMPGVPRELHKMMELEVEPLLRERLRPIALARRVYRVLGLGESALAQRIEPLFAAARERSPGLAAMFVHYRASYPEVVVVLEGTPDAEGRRASDDELRSLDGAIADAAGPALYGIGEADLATRLVRSLKSAGLSIATAESCTAGGTAALVAAVPGASAVLVGGIVAYDNRVKVEALHVAPDLLEAHGAVSEPVSRAMAEGARLSLRSDLAIAITGIAGPTGGSTEKPVGTVHIAISDQEATTHQRLRLLGNRGTLQSAASRWALKLLWDRLVERDLAAMEALDSLSSTLSDPDHDTALGEPHGQ